MFSFDPNNQFQSIRRSGWSLAKILEAGACLAAAKLLLSMPFHWLTPYLGSEGIETNKKESDQSALAVELGQSVIKLSNKLPWALSTLEEALALHLMLRRRNFSHTLYLGLFSGDTRSSSTGQSKAQAWIRCGKKVCMVEKTVEGYQSVLVFGWAERPVKMRNFEQ